jgi:multidrug efflux pump subunit AcrA (membrane-fusion protein)
MSTARFRRGRALTIAAVVVGIAIGGFALSTRAGAVPDVPTAAVTKGEFVDYLQVRGEIRPAKSIVLAAPMQAGELQIVKLAKNGSAVKPGDVVIEFDGTSLRQRMQEKQSELKQADAEIAQVQAQQRITLQQDDTAVMRAKYELDRAKLDLGKRDLVSQLEYEQAKPPSPTPIRRCGGHVKETSDRPAGADVTAKRRKRDKAQFDLDRAQQGLAALSSRPRRSAS